MNFFREYKSLDYARAGFKATENFVIPKGEQGPPGDKGEPGGDAANTNFDDTTAGLGVTNVQEAIELLARSISRAIIVSGKS